jgi:hypothetical protein
MGTYLYSLKKKTVKAKLVPDGRMVTVALMSFVVRACWDFDDYHPKTKAVITRAEKLVKSGFKPDFYYAGDKIADGSVYKFKGSANRYDTPDLGEEGGFLVKFKNRYYILPVDERGYVRFKHYMPEMWNHMYNESMYVRMNDRYVATVRCLASLEDYMFGFGSNDVDVRSLEVTDRRNAPYWMQCAVRQLLDKKRLEKLDEFPKDYFADWFKNVNPQNLT